MKEGNSSLGMQFALDSANRVKNAESKIDSSLRGNEASEAIQDSAKIAESNKNNPCEAPESRPLRGAKNREQGCSSATADFLLEAEKRGSPPKSEKRQLLARRGSGVGGAALLRKEASESNLKKKDSIVDFANQVRKTTQSTQDSPQKLTQKKLTKDGFGFSFNPSKCAECGGKCCIGESGYIFLSKDEMGKIAEFLGLNFGDFTSRFVRQVGVKYSLIEKPYQNGFACIFFDESTRQCQIYPVRPAQCKEFPFWDIFKNNTDGAKRECEGVEIHSDKI
ncbi:YkgJ family cysteine cluster protein [Helicobacter sp. 23-1045]